MDNNLNELLYEHRLVLTIWHEAKALQGADGPETVAAAKRLAELKLELERLRIPAAA